MTASKDLNETTRDSIESLMRGYMRENRSTMETAYRYVVTDDSPLYPTFMNNLVASNARALAAKKILAFIENEYSNIESELDLAIASALDNETHRDGLNTYIEAQTIMNEGR